MVRAEGRTPRVVGQKKGETNTLANGWPFVCSRYRNSLLGDECDAQRRAHACRTACSKQRNVVKLCNACAPRFISRSVNPMPSFLIRLCALPPTDRDLDAGDNINCNSTVGTVFFSPKSTKKTLQNLHNNWSTRRMTHTATCPTRNRHGPNRSSPTPENMRICRRLVAAG